jgi:hypothetical protein
MATIRHSPGWDCAPRWRYPWSCRPVSAYLHPKSRKHWQVRMSLPVIRGSGIRALRADYCAHHRVCSGGISYVSTSDDNSATALAIAPSSTKAAATALDLGLAVEDAIAIAKLCSDSCSWRRRLLPYRSIVAKARLPEVLCVNNQDFFALSGQGSNRALDFAW